MAARHTTPHPFTAAFLGLTAIVAASPAFAQDTATVGEACAAFESYSNAFKAKTEPDCDEIVSNARQSEEKSCAEMMAKCKPTTRAWVRNHLTRLAQGYAGLPQCTGDGKAWMREHFGPLHQRVSEEIGTVPVDKECGFIGLGAFAVYGSYSAVVNTPERIDVNINLFGQPQRAQKVETMERAEPSAPAPAPAETARVESDVFVLKPDAGPSRRFHISALGTLGGYGGFTFGVGGLVGVPLRNSVIPVLNDALYFEAGARMGFVSWTNGATGSFLQLVAGARWDVHLSQEWSVYVAARVVPAISFDLVPGRFAAGGAVGAHWRFVEALGLRVEFDGSNYGGSATAGATVFF